LAGNFINRGISLVRIFCSLAFDVVHFLMEKIPSVLPLSHSAMVMNIF
jgi:hypothetical protein